MRPWLAVVLAWTAGAVPARALGADCACSIGTFELWPASGTRLPTNPRLVLQASGGWEREAKLLLDRHPRLVWKEDVVPLSAQVLQQIDKGNGFLGPIVPLNFLAVLTPAHPLKPSGRYHLELDPWRSDKVPEEGIGRKMHEWPIGPGRDVDAPRWKAAPRLESASSAKDDDCGERTELVLNAEVEDDGEAVRPLAWISLQGAPLFSALVLLPREGTRSRLTHAPCQGPLFPLEPSARFRVQWIAVDAAGNAASAPGGVMRVAIPAARRLVPEARRKATKEETPGELDGSLSQERAR